MGRPRLLHLATTDLSLVLLLGRQLKAFEAAGYEVITASAPGDQVPVLEAKGLPHESVVGLTRRASLRSDLAAIRDMYRLFRRLRPDVVHTHSPKAGVYGRLAARAARVPTVVNTVHGLYAQRTDSWKRRIAVYSAERLASACSDVELVQNEEDVATLRRLGVPARKIRLLGNGIDLEEFDPDRHADERAVVRAEFGFGPRDIVCGVVGRLVREKGLREVFAAADRLRPTLPEVKWLVVGPPDPVKSDAITDQEIEWALAHPGMHALGMRTDMPRLYAAMDLLVLASHREGFPRAGMEAAAMGLPIVASDIRGCRQVVDHGRNGFLVPKGDVDAIASAVSRLAHDPDLRCRMRAEACEKTRAEFDEARVVAITLDAYASVGAPVP